MRSTILILSLTVLLAGCGGSENSEGDVVITPSGPQTGYFVDSPVAGVAYSTPTHSGVTGADGAFTYLPGEIVTFRIGGITLGAGQGQPLMTPFDLFDGAQVPTSQQALVSEINRYTVDDQRLPGTLRAVHLLRVLQALDSDGDPDNGITIHPDMAALLDAVNFDLATDKYKFNWMDESLAQHLRRGVAAGALVWVKAPSAERAMAHFLAAQDIVIQTSRVTSMSEDHNNDGFIDERKEYRYDADGYLVEEYTDRGNNGVFERTHTMSYNAQGQLLEESQADTTALGWSWSSQSVYDDAGRMLARNKDNDGDSILDRCETYLYDADGNLTRKEVDNDCDGGANLIMAYTYDALGNLTLEQQDWSGSGVWEAVYSKSYASSAAPFSPTEELRDHNGDGVQDWRKESTYNTAGYVLSEHTDSDGDGWADSIYHYTYDSYGRRLATIAVFDGDGVPSSLETFTYDTLGNLVQDDSDAGADGVVDIRYRYAFTDPENPHKYTSVIREVNGVVERETTYLWRADGHLLRYTNSSGPAIHARGYVYDQDGNQLEFWSSNDSDGQIDLHRWTTFNAAGQPLTERGDDDGDGVVDWARYYTYEEGAAINLEFNVETDD